MKYRKIIAAFCLTLFMVMFGHTIMESGHSHHHDDPDLEICEGLNHHCYDQEDELSISSIDEASRLLDLVNILGTDLLAVLNYQDVLPVDIPSQKRLFDHRKVPLPTIVQFPQDGLRAPPAVSA